LKISVAMATLNGSKFIFDQLQSLALQKHIPWELVVCDDGSIDDTVERIQEFAESAPFPVRVYRNETNLGFARNFLKAARLCQGEWISYCDQDDVWLPNKLEDVCAVVEQDPIINLVLQNAFICNETLSHEGRLFPNRIRQGSYLPQSQYGFWVWPGFLQTFKANLLHILDEELLPKSYYPGHARMTHDKWTCLIANATGKIRVIENPAALYRRHEKAVTGSYERQGIAARVKKSLPVTGETYSFLATVAAETATYLRDIALQAKEDTDADFTSASNAFDRIAYIHVCRAELYDSPRLFLRTKSFFAIIRAGGYLGPPMISLGGRSALKDVLRVIGIIAPGKYYRP